MSRHRRRLSRRQRGILKMKRKLALLFVVIVLLLMGIIVPYSARLSRSDEGEGRSAFRP